MKTKDIVKHLLSVEGESARFDAVTKVVGDLIIETKTIQTARKANSDTAIIAIQREAFSKWKSIVTGIKAIEADYPVVGVNLYPVMIMEISPGLFLDCFNANAFLGMQMTDFLNTRISELRQQYILNKSIATLKAFEKAVGRYM